MEFKSAEELRELEDSTRLYSKIREEYKERITYSMKNTAEKLGLSTVTIHFEGKPYNKTKLAVLFEIKEELEGKGHHVILTEKAHGGEGLLPSHFEFQLKIEWTKAGIKETEADKAIQILLRALNGDREEVFITVRDDFEELEKVLRHLGLSFDYYYDYYTDDYGLNTKFVDYQISLK